MDEIGIDGASGRPGRQIEVPGNDHLVAFCDEFLGVELVNVDRGEDRREEMPA
ncbi:MAG: hypothetical protein RH982_11300 [Parvibaculum sp.]|uniref:hypothetical protein n=1 Tax=Parvibaculum sp. TaxID=2024848 RepID=UPI0032ED5BAF